MSLEELQAQYTLRSGVYVRPSHQTFGYSDGEVNERLLLERLERTHDLGLGSPELLGGWQNWAMEYHLSPLRANLLRALPLERFQQVLELGAGCGAITRQLGEQAGQVIAVEGNFQRARIARERCRDLANVHLYCDNFENLALPMRFDLITMIGSLEYAPLFIQGSDPVGQCLNLARRHLAPGGVLVIAIENQLGLKYFNGCGEDHLGEPYFGLNDLYARTATTWGHHELKRRLLRAGFPEVEFWFPFPDYKLPELIVREAALEEEALECGGIIGQFLARDYAERPWRNFSEALVWPLLGRNHLIHALANSFLVLASPGQSRLDGAFDWLLKLYNVQREAGYQTETTFLRENGSLNVKKQALDSQSPQAQAWQVLPRQEAYVPGPTLGLRLAKGFLQREHYQEYLVQMRAWVAWLRERGLPQLNLNELPPSWQKASKLFDEWLPGQWLDGIPRNLIESPEGWQAIDQEWVWPHPIPLLWVVWRGLLTNLGDHRTLAASCAWFPHCTVGDWLKQTLAEVSCSLGATTEEIQSRWETLLGWELSLRQEISGQSPEKLQESLETVFASPIGGVRPPERGASALYEHVFAQKNHEMQLLADQLQATENALRGAQEALGYRAGEWLKGYLPQSWKASLKKGIRYLGRG